MPGDVGALTTLPDQHNGTLNTVGVTARPAGRPTVDTGGMTMTQSTSETKHNGEYHLKLKRIGEELHSSQP